MCGHGSAACNMQALRSTPVWRHKSSAPAPRPRPTTAIESQTFRTADPNVRQQNHSSHAKAPGPMYLTLQRCATASAPMYVLSNGMPFLLCDWLVSIQSKYVVTCIAWHRIADPTTNSCCKTMIWCCPVVQHNHHEHSPHVSCQLLYNALRTTRHPEITRPTTPNRLQYNK